MKRFIDIGANLTDEMYQGLYHGKMCHTPDIKIVIERAFDKGISKLICTGGSLIDSKAALNVSDTHENIYVTVGCHPTRCQEFESSPDNYLNQLSNFITSRPQKIVAIGECGLDYDRLHFCPKEIQLKYFEKQLGLAKLHNLPLFLHCRNCHPDFMDILLRNMDCLFRGAVIHSFTGTLAEMEDCINLAPNIYIGINGCSLKTEENLMVASQIPIDRIMIETDAPWCEIKPSHASYKYVKTHFPSKKKEKYDPAFLVKGRNEPCTIVQVLEVLAAVKKEPDLSKLATQIYENTEKIFCSRE